MVSLPQVTPLEPCAHLSKVLQKLKESLGFLFNEAMDALPEINRPERETYHSPPSGVEIKTECTIRVFYACPKAIMAATGMISSVL